MEVMSQGYGTVSPCGGGKQFLGARIFRLPSFYQLQICRRGKFDVKFRGCNFLKKKRAGRLRRILKPAAGPVSRGIPGRQVSILASWGTVLPTQMHLTISKLFHLLVRDALPQVH